MDSIATLIRKAETNFIAGTTKFSEYVDFSLHDTLERIIAYLNSRHITGNKDSLGRDKPFFNIVTAAVNIWYRATDLDRKDMIVRASTRSGEMAAFIATHFLQAWMRKTKFGVFLNQWGRTLAQYGSAVVKFVEKDGRLTCLVVPWSHLIVDPVDFNAIPVIEKIYKTPAQLRKMTEYDQVIVENLINAKGVRKNLRGERKDNTDEFIELYEVHGELPKSYLKDWDKVTEKDKKTYRQQFHVISYQATKEGEYNDFTLYKGLEAKPIYMLTHLIEEDGRTLSIGAVESLFDAQWMQNHTIKNMKDTLDIASKLILQTADPNYANKNLSQALETGDMFIHALNSPLTQVNLSKGDIGALQNFLFTWQNLAKELTSTPDVQKGITPPSGTPLGTSQILQANSNSLFEIMTENKGLALEEMMREYIFPNLKKTMLNNKDELATYLKDADIKKIDSVYIPNEAIKRYNNQAKEQMLSGLIPSPFNQAAAEGQIAQELAPLGNTRYFSPEDVNWKEVFKDFEWQFDSGITDETINKQAILASLSSILQIISNLARDNTNVKLVSDKLLGQVGAVSPVELAATPAGGVAPEVFNQAKQLQAV